MTGQAMFTVDVESWTRGMAAAGVSVRSNVVHPSGLERLCEDLEGRSESLTFYVVGDMCDEVAHELAFLAASGHEIASHGLSHSPLPTDEGALVDWLRRSRGQLEDACGVAVHGFRPPRFLAPVGMTLKAFRSALVEAGFSYVSDLATGAGVDGIEEVPVLQWGGFRLGSGSYQRFLPRTVTAALTARESSPVLYFHSYDFGDELQRVRGIPPSTWMSQVFLRARIPKIFFGLLDRFGSTTWRARAGGIR